MHDNQGDIGKKEDEGEQRCRTIIHSNVNYKGEDRSRQPIEISH